MSIAIAWTHTIIICHMNMCTCAWFVRSNGNIASFFGFKLMCSRNIGNIYLFFLVGSLLVDYYVLCLIRCFFICFDPTITTGLTAIAYITEREREEIPTRSIRTYTFVEGIINNIYMCMYIWMKGKHKTDIQATNFRWEICCIRLYTYKCVLGSKFIVPLFCTVWGLFQWYLCARERVLVLL